MRYIIIQFALFFMNLNYVLYNSFEMNVYTKNALRIIAIILLMFSLLFSKKKVKVLNKDYYWIVCLILPLFGMKFNINLINYLYIFLFLILSRDIKTEKIISWCYKIMIIMLLIIAMLLITGTTKNVQYMIDGRLRNTFGFNNVNAFSNIIYSFSLLYILTRRKIRVINLAFISILVYLFFHFTDTRTSMYSFVIFVLLLVFSQFAIKKKKISEFKYIVSTLVMIPIIFTFLSPILLRINPRLDVILSRRLSVFAYYIEANKYLTLVSGGTKVPDIDNGFLVTLYSVGFIFSVFLIFMILKSISQMVFEKDYLSIATVVSFIFFNAFESSMLRPELMITIIFWVLIYRKFTTPKVKMDTEIVVSQGEYSVYMKS